MNLKEFGRASARKRQLAVELAVEYVKALRGDESNVREALYEYYWYVHDAIYDADAPQYILLQMPHDEGFNRISDEDERVMAINNSRLTRFNAEKDAIDGIARQLYVKYDNGEIELF